MEQSRILAAAEQLLSVQYASASVRLTPLELHSGARSVAIRCRLTGAPNGAPPTVFVKHPILRPDFPLYHVYALLDDWAACRFLNTIPGDPPLAPAFLGGDTERCILVLEDLGAGDGANTTDLLNGDDPEAAEQALVEHVALLARLHGATMGKADEYEQLRASLGVQAPRMKLYTDPWSNARRRPSPDEEVASAVARYRALLESVGVDGEPGFAEEIEWATRRVEDDPGPYLGLCKGDQHLGGDYRRSPGGKPRLYDFDSAGFRHVLIEGMPGRMTWGCYGHIPADIVSRMETVYQAELSRYCPAAADLTCFRSALVDAGARWHVFHVIHRLPVALERDGRQGPTTIRRLRLAWIEAFVNLSVECRHYSALGRSAHALAQRLRNAWSLEGRPQPPYRAFSR